MTATPVTVLSTSVSAECPVCARPATWQVGPGYRSCTNHLGVVLAELHDVDPSPFIPHLPTPLRWGKW